MQDSAIIISSHSTTFAGPDAVALFRVKTIRSAIKLHKATGMMMTRGATITKMLGEVTKLTGKRYTGATKHDAAMADLDQHIAALTCAMPIEVRE